MPQFTQTFKTLDGSIEFKAIIKARKVKNGWTSVIKLADLPEKTLSGGAFTNSMDALTFGLRALSQHKENAVL